MYGIGRFILAKAGAMRFLMEMESLMSEGKADEVCAMFHDDLEVNIADHSGEGTQTGMAASRTSANSPRETVPDCSCCRIP